ncbi:MAG: NFACT RNA binding domain-containing protein, partial [Planctomycetota bacterium]|nr:NFACT RNA binding domain-containing protein [Planctomycetota bacterium]
PARRNAPADDPPSRFETPVLAAIDAFFTSADQDEERQALQRRLSLALDRATRKLADKIDGLARQQTEIARIDELRSHADLLLAYGFSAAPGAESITVPDPNDPEAELIVPLQPGKPVQVQADKLYQRARKLEQGQAMAAQRRQEAESERDALVQFSARLASATEIPDLEELFTDLVSRGLMRAAKRADQSTQPARSKQLDKITKGHKVRCFTSETGDLIMVGRTNQQNDRLSLAIARGNDYWLHVGRGYAGSHVVVRIPKEKTPSLETLLDAGTLAIHFSKARNAERCEVIYTRAKNVRKPKGLPPGKVTTTDTRTLQIDMEPGRLKRLLDSAIGAE